jgi:hypothetical protein
LGNGASVVYGLSIAQAVVRLPVPIKLASNTLKLPVSL